jgi:metallo-beta-lactamase class B
MILRVSVLLSVAALALADEPFPPHHIIGNVYYVGSHDLASFLITTPRGHILINSSYEQTVPLIEASVEKLGFHFRDINILLDSHAHRDHVGGNPLVKQLTGATVMVMQEDVKWQMQRSPPRQQEGVPGAIDRVLHNGDQVKLGGTVLTAHLTPGHTPGATTWTMTATEGGKPYHVVISSSIGVNADYVLVNNSRYPKIADDYRRSFEVMRALPCDIYLAPHGAQYGLIEKYAKLDKGGPNPFIDPEGYRAYVDNSEKLFLEKLEEQKRGR